MKIAAGIVTYNPNLDRFKKNIEAISSQVERVFVVDNHSYNIAELQNLIVEYNNVECIENEKNVGVSIALNQIMENALIQGCEWVLTLDDDSVCDDNLIAVLSKYIAPNIGIVCPDAQDDNIELNDNKSYGKTMFVDSCITAGSLTNVKVWKALGGFDDAMFIDFVDVEYCTRVVANGYKILRVHDTYVNQQYGDNQGCVSILGKKLYLYNYSPQRVYYSVRNQIYFMRKHRCTISTGKWGLYLLGYCVKRILLEKQRIKSMESIIRGICDGIRMPITRKS